MNRAVVVACLTCWTLVARACVGATGASNMDGLAPDQRLDQKITVKAVGVPLGDFLANLSAKTGVKMTARKDVADVRVAVFAHDLSLLRLQAALKHVLHAHCSRSGNGSAFEYEFWTDLKSRNALEEAKQAERRRLRDFMGKLADDLGLSAQEAEEKYKDDPLTLHDLQDEATRTALSIYGMMAPSLLNALYRDGQLSLSGSDLSPEAVNKLLAAIKKASEQTEAEFARYRAEHPEVVGEWDSESRGDAWTSIATMVLQIEGAALRCEIRPPVLRDENGHKSASMTMMFDADIKGKYHRSEAESERKQYVDSEDAMSGKAIALKTGKGLTLYELLGQISDQTGASVVADYYVNINRFKLTSEELQRAKTLGGAFSDVLDRAYCDLVKEDGTYRITMKEWYRLRAREIPERLAKQWRGSITLMGMQGMKTAVDMAVLNDEQLDDLGLYELGGADWIRGNRELLEFLAVLTDQQWKEAGSGEGLRISGLRRDQQQPLLDWARSDRMLERALIMKVVADERSYAPTLQDISALRIESSPITSNGRPAEYWKFALCFADGKTVDCEFDLPLVQPKPPKKPQDSGGTEDTRSESATRP